MVIIVICFSDKNRPFILLATPDASHGWDVRIYTSFFYRYWMSVLGVRDVLHSFHSHQSPFIPVFLLLCVIFLLPLWLLLGCLLLELLAYDERFTSMTFPALPSIRWCANIRIFLFDTQHVVKSYMELESILSSVDFLFKNKDLYSNYPSVELSIFPLISPRASLYYSDYEKVQSLFLSFFFFSSCHSHNLTPSCLLDLIFLSLSFVALPKSSRSYRVYLWVIDFTDSNNHEGGTNRLRDWYPHIVLFSLLPILFILSCILVERCRST